MRGGETGASLKGLSPRLWGNTALMLFIRVSSRLANALLFILIARRLGVEPAGSFSLAITYATILFTLSLWGLDELLIREVAKNRDQAGFFLLHFGLVRLVLSACSYGILVALLNALALYTVPTRSLISLVGLTVMADGVNFLGQAVFTAFEDLRFPALVALVTGGGRVVGGILGLQFTSSVFNVGLAFVLSSWAGAVLYAVGLAYVLHTRSLSVYWDRNFLLRWLKETPAFAWISLLYVFQLQIDVVLLSLFMGEEAVGLYGAAKTVFTVFLLLPEAYRAALYPMMSRLYGEGEAGDLQKLYGLSFRFLLFLGMPLAVGLTLLAPQVVGFFFGHPIEPAVGALRWIAWALLVQFLNVPNVRLMLAGGEQGLAARFLTVSVGAGLLANLALIPLLGVPGAGLARFLSSLIFLTLMHTTVYRRFCRYNLWRDVLSVITAAGLMGALLALAQGQALWLEVAAGGVAYGVSLLVLNAILVKM